MAAFANMSLNDGVTPTPVAHPFNMGRTAVLPDGRLFFQWLDFSVNAGIPIGANRIEMYARLPTFGRRKGARLVAGDSGQSLSTEVVVTLPTLESLSNNTASGVNPQPTHAYDTTAWLKVVRNGRCGTQPVRDVLAFVRNFTLQAQYTDTVLSYNPPGV